MKKRPKDWPKSGYYWWLHHDRMLEWTDDIDERWDYVLANKPKSELPIRLAAMRPVKGELPEEMCKARAAYDKAWAAYDKAWAAYDKARAACLPQIEALHAVECPDVVHKNGCLVFDTHKER